MTPDRRTLITDAAVGTLAAEGMRGFTHRAVDRAAGLPEGSTSYYFRTREALMIGTLGRMAELDIAEAGAVPELGGTLGLDELTDIVAALVRRFLTTSRARTLARYELSLESTRRPELRATLLEHGAAIRAMAEHLLMSAGAPEPRRRGHTLIAQIDGLVFDQVAGAGTLDEADLRAACRDMLAAALRA
ncbi:TetR/AcrR family transcriptional regulator [Actinophytocola gossypii]|uniref:TetR family transcriptional regulator n=1 Tax=Actinophytocola gossypii TaxID=2812003 RepID=A0ABT2JJB9_9PSEU|nr:TetR/AcrR family transcriptional regulator [Actinophytocola gossypii]MCT2587983.1 TetR family transcriptional regulator [Actinophytocola gossypii]